MGVGLLRLQNKRTFIILSTIFSFFTLLFSLTQPKSVGAVASTNAPKTEVVPNKTYTINEKYAFSPEFTKNTKLTVSSGFVSKPYNVNIPKLGNTLSIDVGNGNYATIKKKAQNGDYWAKYSNVGKVNGRDVDLKITIRDYEFYGIPGSRNSGAYMSVGYVGFRTNSIGYVMQGLEYIDADWTILDSKTDQEVKTPGYYTFSDVDDLQYVGFSDYQWKNRIDKVYLEGYDNVLHYHVRNNYHIFSAETRTDVPDDKYDSRYAFTPLISEISGLRVRWGSRTDLYSKLGMNRTPASFWFTRRHTLGDLMMYTLIPPARFSTPEPIKTQSQGSAQHNTNITYKLEQSVPAQHNKHYYKSFIMRDSVNSVYDVKDVIVRNRAGSNVSSWFNIRKTNSVKVEAKSSTLKNASFYGEDYTVEVKVQLNGNRVNNKFGNSSSYNIKNKATTSADGKLKSTNEVGIKVNKRTITVRHVDDKGKKIADTQRISSVDGLAYSTSPRNDIKNSRGHLYRHIKTEGSPKGTVNGNHEITYIYDEPRRVTIEHRTLTGRDKDIKLGTDTVWEYDGKKVTAKSKEKYFTDSEGYFYRPRKGSETVTVNGETKIILRYDTPRTITVEHFDKDDDRLLRASYIKGIYDGEQYTAKTLIEVLRDVDNYYYRPVDPKDRVGKVDFNMTIRIPYERPRIIEILHKDNDDDSLIRTDIYEKRIYDGDGYDIYSRKDEELEYYHEENKMTYPYYPLDPYKDTQRARKTGSIIEKEVDIGRNTYTIDFFYTKPALDLGLKYIRIDTDRRDDGLPVELTFDHQIIVDDRWKDNDVTLTVYDRDNKHQVYQKNDLQVEDLRQGLKIRVDANHLKKGERAIYEARLSTNDKKGLVTDFATSAAIDTNAYTASERIVRAESLMDESTLAEYRGVAMTERHLGQKVKEFYESAEATLENSLSMISGYGYESNQTMKFETEVDTHEVPELVATAFVDVEASDGDYDIDGGRHRFKLDATDESVDSELIRQTSFEMPKTYVSRRTGEITLDKDKFDNYKEGGRKVYVPIWIDQLGNYKYSVHSNRLGRNYIKFELDQSINIDAYMFGHIDSETLDDDALLVEPAKRSIMDRLFKD